MSEALQQAETLVRAAFADAEGAEWCELLMRLPAGERLASFWWVLARAVPQPEFVDIWRKAGTDLREATT